MGTTHPSFITSMVEHPGGFYRLIYEDDVKSVLDSLEEINKKRFYDFEVRVFTSDNDLEYQGALIFAFSTRSYRCIEELKKAIPLCEWSCLISAVEAMDVKACRFLLSVHNYGEFQLKKAIEIVQNLDLQDMIACYRAHYSRLTGIHGKDVDKEVLKEVDAILKLLSSHLRHS